jgi:tight adherence protein C
MTFLVIVLIWLGVGAVAFALYLWMREQSRQEVVERAIADTGLSGLRQSILRPITGSPTNVRVEKLLKRAPSVWKENATIQQQLIFAGHDHPLAPSIYAAARVGMLVLLPLLAVILLRPNSTMKLFIDLVGGAFVGLVLPVGYLARAVRKRQEKVRRSLPDALDLLVVCVEAGISLDAAILRVARDMVHLHGELAREFLIVNRRTNAGMTREAALRGMWERTGVEELRTLVSSLIQSEKWGTSSSRVLRVSSETLRRKRRFNAEKRAATAPIKMIIPMALLIFPALFVVILGPAVLRIVGAFGQ